LDNKNGMINLPHIKSTRYKNMEDNKIAVEQKEVVI
jgi:hypothetical protein